MLNKTKPVPSTSASGYDLRPLSDARRNELAASLKLLLYVSLIACVFLLIGLIIASVVNMFMASSMLDVIINYAGVLIFVGLTGN